MSHVGSTFQAEVTAGESPGEGMCLVCSGGAGVESEGGA